MANELVSFDSANLLIENAPFLDEVEAFLKTVGEDVLAQKLNKLQCDAGVFAFEGIGDGQDGDQPTDPALKRTQAFLEEPNPEIGPAGIPMEPFDPENLVISRSLHENLELLTMDRFDIFSEIYAILRAHDSDLLEKIRMLAGPQKDGSLSPIVILGSVTNGPQ